jgi:hypothetical protein
MNLHRRHFLGASLASAACLAAKPAGVVAAAPQFTTGQLGQAISALHHHSDVITHRDRLGLADFSAHSREMRFHIIDIAQGKIAKSYFVSHGKGSDPRNSGFVQQLSNRPGSNASSGGAFLTGDAYVGKHGRSRRLHGLDPENDKAFDRAIVIHGANYVSSEMARNQGRVGRSLGCFAFEQSEIGEILERLGPGRLLYAAS